MKTILYKTSLILTLFMLTSCRAYTQVNTTINNLTPFVGAWHWQDGNQIFVVDIYIEGNNLDLRYKLIEINNNTETIIYSSKLPVGNTGLYIPGISCFSDNGITMGAMVADYSWLWNGEDKIKYGTLGIEIQQSSEANPITATWKIEEFKGVRVGDEILEFVIPTDIILTKQKN